MSPRFAFRKAVPAKPTPVPAAQSAADLEALSRETGVPVDVLRTFAAISDPAHEYLFTAKSAPKAFAGVKVRRAHA